MQPGRASVLAYLLTLISGFYAEGVLAVKGWDTNAGLTVQTIYTDNLNLTENDKQSDVGVRVTPSIGVSRATRYNNLYFQYGLSYLTHFESVEGDDLSHNLTAKWQSELQRDWLFLDVSANAGQTLISQSGASGGDDFNNTGNTTQFFTYRISPNTRHHFGNYADMELRYTNDGVLFDSDSASNSGSNAVNFLLQSGKEFNILSWDVNGNYRQRDNDDSGGSDTYQNARATVRYRFDRYLEPFMFVAYRDNNLETESDEFTGAVYGAGVTWTPSRKISFVLDFYSEGNNVGGGVTWTPNERTSLEVRSGLQLSSSDNLQESVSFNFSHRQRRSTLSASYREDYDVYASDEILARQTFQQFDSFGNPILDPITGQPLLTSQDSPDLNDDRYVLRRFDLGYDILIGRRNNLSLNAYYSNRDYDNSPMDENTWGIRSNLSHNISANLDSNFGIWWDKYDDKSSENDDYKQWRVEGGLTYKLGQKTSLAFNLQHLERDAEVNSDGYTENRATLTLGRRW